MDNGASLSATGLSSASPIEPVPVSPVPASIPSANDLMVTGGSLISFSQFVGLGIAEALCERGLWADRGPIDRLQDMASLSRAAISAMQHWSRKAQGDNPTEPLAPADNHPQGGDCSQAPFMGSAVPQGGAQ